MMLQGLPKCNPQHQRCTFRLKVCQYCDFACDLRLLATFRHSAAIARCTRRAAHFPRCIIPCGRKVPKVIATTHINMVTTLRNTDMMPKI